MRHDINWSKDRIRIWEETGKGHYTVKDIPDWVRKELAYRGGGYVRDRMDDLFREARRRENTGVCRFVKINGEVHFNREGYEGIFRYVRRLELMRERDIDKWYEEAFGKT